ncbi:MAG TPA: glycoside hydrolase family 3 C-terminal domain-containing protein, partial [Acidobacteriaceae bacterium]|nr:glycoside hydrolase family 3 C-terminal domain-containing protein [Acidobacteriaceae bacterium]
AKSFMASYNAWNHVPMTVNPILKDLAMKQWGVDGIISTDAGSLGNLVNFHKAYPDLNHAIAAAMKAGIGMFLTIGEPWKDGVRGALEQKLITEQDLDNSLRGSLRVAIRLGLLDPPALVPYSKMKGQPNPVESAEHKAIALQVANESVVLLKNGPDSTGRPLLPLDKNAIRSIAVVGPLAKIVLPDFYGGVPPYSVSTLAAVQKAVPPNVPVMANNDGSIEGDVAVARKADVVVVVVGNNPTCNRIPKELLGSLMSSVAPTASCPIAGEGMESSDRTSLTLAQEDWIKAIYAANPKTIVVLVASAPFAIDWTDEHVPAILHTSHNGQEEGTAIANVLFGETNPAGRLVQTWVKSMDQLPPMMDYNIRHGRTYMYMKDKPLYPFGYGLSYTTFKYGPVNCGSGRMEKIGSVTCSVDVTNTGPRDGDEVVQMYVKHLDSKVERPIHELKGFERVTIARGQTRKVSIPLKASDLAYWDETKNGWTVESETVEVQFGASSADVRATKTIQVTRWQIMTSEK